MKKKHMAVIGMVICFMMMATFAWADSYTGTIKVNGLVWTKSRNCFGEQTWSQAMSSAASLKSGSCGLVDASVAGQWRLPTADELVNVRRNLYGFNNVGPDYYWSSSTFKDLAYIVYFLGVKESDPACVSKNSRVSVLFVRAATSWDK